MKAEVEPHRRAQTADTHPHPKSAVQENPRPSRTSSHQTPSLSLWAHRVGAQKELNFLLEGHGGKSQTLPKASRSAGEQTGERKVKAAKTRPRPRESWKPRPKLNFANSEAEPSCGCFQLGSAAPTPNQELADKSTVRSSPNLNRALNHPIWNPAALTACSLLVGSN